MRLFNDGWEFAEQPLHTTLEEINAKQDIFKPVGLPHDWLIYDTGDLYRDSTGWYRKRFTWKKEADRQTFLRFDGIYMDSKVFVNDVPAAEWKYGYSAFEVDLTPYLKEGENEIKVSADFQSPNSRWYSGAGIYRNVWQKTVHRKHILSDGIYFHAEEKENASWQVEIQAETTDDNPKLSFYLSEAGSEKWMLLEGEYSIIPGDPCVCTLKTQFQNPKIWDVDEPNCYCLRADLEEEGKVLHSVRQTVGFRTLDFSPDKGFSLNGRKLKLNGVCEHHDLGCLGSAYHAKAMERKLRILKEMGVNALRLAHNMHAENVMDLADRMGILVVSEAFDMWESTKNDYDYGRFFTQWYERDVASWVRRDRNHPSLILWSIGNEIYDTHISERGQMWTRILMDEVAKHDEKGNARPTIGSNYMPWENARKCADIIKIAGYNYGEKYYEEHHRAHPDWILYGSETSSTVQSRGIYHFPYQQSVLADEDEQCSSLGNASTSWGARSSEACIIAERDHAYSCGQFIWTGFDYIGEPTPYHTRNSYFGQIDTAGFPKDSFYIYQAAWTDYKKKPMVHIFPYWDFNEGQLIDIRVCSNAPVVELYLDGHSQGTFRIDHERGQQLVGHWQLPYTAGEIRAVACDRDGRILAEETRYSFGEAAKICLKPENKQLLGDGQDLLFLQISMEDEAGHPVENANNRVHIEVEGPGRLVGTDNGDSTETDGYKTCDRRLFSGKLLAVCKADAKEGELTVTVTSPGLPTARIAIPVVAAKAPEGISPLAYCFEEESSAARQEIPVRNIRLTSRNGLHLYEENRETTVQAVLCPEQADDRDVIWSVVDDGGIPSNLAEIRAEGLQAHVCAKSDGQFRLRCMSRCGTGKIRIISQLEFMVSGLGKAYKNPYEFVSAGLYDYSYGSIGNGNEHGVATARDGESRVGFREIDFGPYGSDEIHLPVFALTDEPYEIKIYEGMPDEEGAQLIADVIYQKPSIWNTYQEETYHLDKRLSGITSLCFVLEKKVHLKGFSFTGQSRAWERLMTVSCDSIYGDSFIREKEQIREIGNNVTIGFTDMDFGEEGAGAITICGSTPLQKNTIILKFTRGDKEERRMLEFACGKGQQTFTFDKIYGSQTVSFVFLPGSRFDFAWFEFAR